MKKVISLLLVLCMVFALCACGAKEEAAPAKEAAPAEAPAEAPAVDDTVYTLNFYHTFAGAHVFSMRMKVFRYAEAAYFQA